MLFNQCIPHFQDSLQVYTYALHVREWDWFKGCPNDPTRPSQMAQSVGNNAKPAQFNADADCWKRFVLHQNNRSIFNSAMLMSTMSSHPNEPTRNHLQFRQRVRASEWTIDNLTVSSADQSRFEYRFVLLTEMTDIWKLSWLVADADHSVDEHGQICYITAESDITYLVWHWKLYTLPFVWRSTFRMKRRHSLRTFRGCCKYDKTLAASLLQRVELSL